MVRILKWLQQWISKTHRQHQLQPQRFHIRSLSIAVIILFPLSLWFSSFLKGPSLPHKIWMGKSCPPREPVSLFELKKYPERFHLRRIWIVGTLQIVQKNV